MTETSGGGYGHQKKYSDCWWSFQLQNPTDSEKEVLETCHFTIFKTVIIISWGIKWAGTQNVMFHMVQFY